MFRDKVLEEFEPDILDIYEKNEYERLNMTSVYDYMEEKYGPLPAHEQSLRNFIHYLIQTDKLKLDERLSTYTQVPDLPFVEFKCRSGLKLYILAVVLLASRYEYVAFKGRLMVVSRNAGIPFTPMTSVILSMSRACPCMSAAKTTWRAKAKSKTSSSS